MRDRILAANGVPLIVAGLAVAGLLVSVPAAAQTPAGSKATRPPATTSTTGKAATAKKWRTPWGDPDLQGSWSNTATTPLERPAKYAGRELMTTQERAEEEARRAKSEGGSFYDPPYADGRTSLIYDPQDGKIPPLTPDGQKRQAAWRESLRNNGPFNGPEEADMNTRCIVRDALPRIPRNYANSYEILQAPGFAAVYQEGVHETRIVPLDGRPHLDPSVRQWLGDSRGHWEGDTLVVETTNFNDQTKFQGSTSGLRLVERWTRVADGRIDYRFTVSDPATWTKPWSAAIAWNKSGTLYEYACHEDNIDLYGILTGSRAAEQKAAEAAKKGTK